MRRGLSVFNVTSVALGLAFLYLPILILVIYSFNASRLVTVWGGWSTRWYVSLLGNSDARSGLGVAAHRLPDRLRRDRAGHAAALALVRAGRFAGGCCSAASSMRRW